jgi:hypothetical protein
MTQAAKKLLDEFDALADRDRSELVAELVRRVALAPHDLPGADVVAAADRLFGGTGSDLHVYIASDIPVV